MKTIKITILLIAVSFVGYYLFKNIQDFGDIVHTEEGLETPAINNKHSIEVNGNEYAYAWVQISNPENVFLFPNFKEKYTLDEGIDNYGCKNLISGGFYTETNSPIGLFISEVGKLSDEVSNKLFNGYFTLTRNGIATISRNYSGRPVRIGLQAGPILLYSGVVQELNLVRDKIARRNVIALTKEGEIYFITIYDKESVFVGPLLANLPEIINNIQNEIGAEFNSALNLDGGSASAFYTQDIQLSELTPIGSFFCER